MKKKSIIVAGALLCGSLSISSCSSTQEQASTQPAQQTNREQPSVIELLTEFDEDDDGQLSRSEVKGPLEQNFDQIDSNKDGFLSVEELKNAPKPEGKPDGSRPPRGERPPGRSPRN